MKNLFVTALCALVFISCSFAQATFRKSFVAPDFSFGASDVFRTADNNFLFAASRSTLSGLDEMGVLLKTDTNGNEIWKVTCGFGFTGSLSHVAEKHGFYYGVGSINTGVVFSCPLIKTDAEGNLIWKKRIDFRDRTIPSAFITTNDGHLLIAGTADDDSTAGYSFLMKVDTSGAVVWTKTYTHSASMDFSLRDVIVNSDSTMYITGTANVGGSPSVVSFLALLDAEGNTLWSRRIQGGNSFIGLQQLLPTTANGCFVAGVNEGTSTNICLSKIDNTGAIVWTKTYTVASGDAHLRNVEYQGGDIVFAGIYEKPGNANTDMLLFRVSLNGSLLNSNTIGTNANEESFKAIPYNGDGRLLVLGSTETDAGADALLLTVTSSDLSATCNNNGLTMTVSDLTPLSSNLPLTVSIAGAISAANFNAPAITLEDTVLCSTVGIREMEHAEFVISPNPASAEFNIRSLNFKAGDVLRIYDVLGKEVYATRLSSSTLNLKTGALNLEDGIYVVQWTAGKEYMRRKLLVQN